MKSEYQIEYRDKDPACPVFRMKVRASGQKAADFVLGKEGGIA